MLGHLPKAVNDFMLRNIGAWLLAVLVTYATAALAATQSVIARLADMGVAVSLADRLRTTSQDLVGMAPMFAPMIAVAFLVAFPVAALVLRWRPHWRWFGYPLAGAVALLAQARGCRQGGGTVRVVTILIDPPTAGLGHPGETGVGRAGACARHDAVMGGARSDRLHGEGPHPPLRRAVLGVGVPLPGCRGGPPWH